MPALRTLIEELVDVQRAIGVAADAACRNPARKGDLVAARRRLANHLLIVAQAIDEAPQLRTDPALARVFRERFSAMRSKVASHQAKWPAVLIDTVNDEFHASATAVRESNRAFATWALDVLK